MKIEVNTTYTVGGYNAADICTKKGELKVKFEKVIRQLFNGYKIHMAWTSGSRPTLDRRRYDWAMELATVLKLDYTTGNDAPRGGMNGYYVQLTDAGMQRAKRIKQELNLQY